MIRPISRWHAPAGGLGQRGRGPVGDALDTVRARVRASPHSSIWILDSESQRKRQVLRVRARRGSSGGGGRAAPDRLIEGKASIGVSVVRKSLPVAWPPGNSVPRRRWGSGRREPAAGALVLLSYPVGWEGGKLAGRGSASGENFGSVTDRRSRVTSSRTFSTVGSDRLE